MSDPRNNAGDAYAVLRSLLNGGVLQPAEQIGFERALQDRGHRA